MKFYIAIAVVLALLAFTQAQDESNKDEPSNQPESLNQPEQSEQDSSPAPPSDEHRPPRPEGSERPPKPGRPGRRPHGHRILRPQPIDEPQAENGNLEGIRSQDFPHRKPVFFDINFDFGKQNTIRGNKKANTAAP